MKRSLYPRLAWQGIRKIGKIYFPYLAASIFVVMVYYLIGFLSNDPVVREMEGGEQMQLILMMGSSVMAVFSVIFLFYTNSFLMKRRRKELGLYPVYHGPGHGIRYDEPVSGNGGQFKEQISQRSGGEYPFSGRNHCVPGGPDSPGSSG